MNEGTIIHTGGTILGIILLAFGLKYKIKEYIIPGILWFLTNLIFIFCEDKVRLKLNRHIFAFLFMAIPALVMGPIVICGTYKYNHQFLRYIVLSVILIDLLHLFQASKEMFFLCILIFLLARQFRSVNYDDVHQNIEQNYDYINKSDILFVIPKYQGVKLTDDLNFINKIRQTGKILGMHGVTHEPTSYFNKAEFGYNVSEDNIEEGMKIFENAFGYKPKLFKAPCYNLLPENQTIIEKHGMKVVGPKTLIFNRLLHPNSDNIFMTIANAINNYI